MHAFLDGSAIEMQARKQTTITSTLLIPMFKPISKLIQKIYYSFLFLLQERAWFHNFESKQLSPPYNLVLEYINFSCK